MTKLAQDRSSEDYVLADEIAATPAERRILSSLGIRRNGAASLPALRTAVRTTAAAAARHPSARAAEWVAILRALLERVASLASQVPWLDMLCPVIANRTASDVLADPARSSLPAESRARLDAWLGVHMFEALTRGGVLSSAVLDSWETLRRTGMPRTNTPASWIGAAKHMPLDVAEITQILPTIRNERLQDARKLTLVALAADIPAPDTVTDLFRPGGISELGSLPSNTDEGEHDDTDDDEEGASSTNTSSPDRHLLMGLLRHRALYAAYRGQFGVTAVYGELPLPNLRRICTALAATLHTGSDADRTRAAVAEVSLKVPLSPRRTLGLALECNDDVWLDLLHRSILWNFDRVLDARDRDAEVADEVGRCKPIPIRLSDRCVARLQELLAQRPSALSLRELVGIADDAASVTAWLREYGVFLRAHGESNYKAYPVRFARSYRSAYLDRGHGAVAAAMLGLDFATVPGGLLHYVSLAPEQVTAWQMDVDRYLGLHWTSGAMVGAR